MVVGSSVDEGRMLAIAEAVGFSWYEDLGYKEKFDPDPLCKMHIDEWDMLISYSEALFDLPDPFIIGVVKWIIKKRNEEKA